MLSRHRKATATPNRTPATDSRATAIGCRVVPANRVAQTISADRANVLAVVSFGTPPPPGVDVPTIALPCPPLGGPAVAEIWTAASPVSIGEEHGIHYASDGTVMFGAIRAPTSTATVEIVTHELYRKILDFLTASGFSHLLRIWNAVPHINAIPDAGECYQLFCVGRYRAFAERAEWGATGERLPAATAVGTVGNELYVHFIAAKEPGIHIENPRQVSAYHYPRQYGPRSPSFSRATLSTGNSPARLYISGTASIVGHETRHAHNLPGQLREILHNLDVLLVHVAAKGYYRWRSVSELSLLKVYLRRAEDVEPARQLLAGHLYRDTMVIFLQADICRSDLVVEIEALGEAPCSTSATSA